MGSVWGQVGLGLERKFGSQIAFQSRQSGGWDRQKIVPALDQPTGFSHRSECGKKEEERLDDDNNNGQPRIANATSGGARKATWANLN